MRGGANDSWFCPLRNGRRVNVSLVRRYSGDKPIGPMTAEAPANTRRPTGACLALVFLLSVTFLMGGGSRPDIASLVLLRPLAALLLGYAVWGLTRTQLARHRFLYLMAAAVIALVLVQLVPLPPAVWTALPGRDLIVAIDEAAGIAGTWRPLSLVPSGSWNALFSLIVPLTALVLASRLRSSEQAALLPVILAIGLGSAVIAVLQLAAPSEGLFYFYRVTNQGAAVGLFANRNHQAVFLSLLFPLLAVFAATDRKSAIDARIRVVLALAIGGFLIPLILVTGSRTGLVTMVIGLISIAFLYAGDRGGHSATGDRRRMARGGVALGILALVLLTVFLGRALAISRIVDPGAGDDARYRAWGPMFETGMKYFPAGSGFGSFADVFKVDEPRTLLATTIFAHAHSDWLELMITGGLPALILLGIAVVAFIIAVARWWRRRGDCDDTVLMAGAGLWMMVILAVASVADYPLRVPSLACLFCVIVVWINSLASRGTEREGV